MISSIHNTKNPPMANSMMPATVKSPVMRTARIAATMM